MQDTRIDDYLKLRRLLSYLKEIVDESIFVKANNLYVIVTLVDIWYIICDCYKSYTREVILFRIGLILLRFLKQKLNIYSSI